MAFINGKAPSKTPVVIKLYGTTDMTRKNFNLNKLPNDKDYIKKNEESVNSGNMGFFQKQLDLVMGVNKIIINYEGEKPHETIVYVYDKAFTFNNLLLNVK